MYPSEPEIKDTKDYLTTQLYDNRDDFISPSLASHIYVAIYHHQLHIVCMSPNSFDALGYVLQMIRF